MASKTRLICFPYAGGNAFVYRDMLRHLPPAIEPWFVEYPGHGQRIAQPLIRNLDVLAEQLFDELALQGAFQGRYALYGHSMGAVVALLVARRIVASGYLAPVHLLVTGKSSPADHVAKQRHLLESGEFWRLLTTMGGMAPELVEHQEMKSFLEPIIRADFEALDTWSYVAGCPLNVPVSAAIGSDEAIFSHEMLNWSLETTCAFQWRSMPGNHFFIQSQAHELCRWLSAACLMHEPDLIL